MAFLKGKTKGERQELIGEVIKLIEGKGLSLEEIGKKYGVTRQAISFALTKHGYYPREYMHKASLKGKEDMVNKILLEKWKTLKKRARTLEVNLIQERHTSQKLREEIKENKEVIRLKEMLKEVKAKYKLLQSYNKRYKNTIEELKTRIKIRNRYLAKIDK